ncbi:MAG: hypothetical protein DRO39_01495 [Thermoprotei archaeon]|nr:MAG: hypothetical protein DRO39_01495 [Thermoprotei archaeon]
MQCRYDGFGRVSRIAIALCIVTAFPLGRYVRAVVGSCMVSEYLVSAMRRPGDHGVSTGVEESYSYGEDYGMTVGEGVRVSGMATVDLWLDRGSIYVVLGRGEHYIEVDAKVIIGVGRGGITDIEVLLDREGVEKLRELLRPHGYRE